MRKREKENTYGEDSGCGGMWIRKAMAEDGAREVVRRLVRAEDGLEADADALSFHISLSLLKSGIRRGERRGASCMSSCLALGDSMVKGRGKRHVAQILPARFGWRLQQWEHGAGRCELCKSSGRLGGS